MQEAKTAQVGIRLTESERRKLMSMAAASRMTMTDVVVALINGADGILPPRVVAKMQRSNEQRVEYSR